MNQNISVRCVSRSPSSASLARVSRNQTSPLFAPFQVKIVLKFSGAWLSRATDLRNYWITQLMSSVSLKHSSFFLLGTGAGALLASFILRRAHSFWSPRLATEKQHSLEWSCVRLLSIVAVSLYRQVGVCSTTTKDDPWENPKEETKEQRVGKSLALLLNSWSERAHPGRLFCLLAGCSLSFLRGAGQPSE